MFDVGDEVYSKMFGEGFVTDVDDNDLYLYPIHVQWKNSSKRDIFTPEGKYDIHFNDPDKDICILKVGGFQVGDHVISKHFGEGVVTRIVDPLQYEYPVEVHWIGACPRSFDSSEYFTKDGKFNYRYPKPDYDIIKKEDEGEMGQIAGVINHNIQNDIKPWGKYFDDKEDEKVSKDKAKFHVGDMVYSNRSGVGKIIKIGANKNLEYPIEVKWCDKKDCATFDYDFFTLAGTFFSDHWDAEKDIVPVGEVSMEFEEKDDGTIERMEDALNKKVEDAVNPAHYKVKGLPEAIDIMNHLMKRCQLEGYLWGNILKYAYRYGRKGDKAETAGKIEWYARQLKELGECESEECEKNDSEGTHGVGEEE